MIVRKKHETKKWKMRENRVFLEEEKKNLINQNDVGKNMCERSHE